MGRLVVRILFLFLSCLAISCESERALDNKEIGVSASKLTTLADLSFPIPSMTSWTNANYGACGSSYFTDSCHNGADIMTGVNTTVHAITAGTVISVSAKQD